MADVYLLRAGRAEDVPERLGGETSGAVLPRLGVGAAGAHEGLAVEPLAVLHVHVPVRVHAEEGRYEIPRLTFGGSDMNRRIGYMIGQYFRGGDIADVENRLLNIRSISVDLLSGFLENERVQRLASDEITEL